MNATDQTKPEFETMITLYGRKPVLEVLQDNAVDVHCLHLADSNRNDGIMAEIIDLATTRGINVREHSRMGLSRISRNKRQDQGVAIDLVAPACHRIDELTDTGADYLLLDGVTNPQNLGMILRSVAASGCGGVIIPREGSAWIDPLAFKASAGCALKATIYRADNTLSAMTLAAERGFELIGMDAGGDKTLAELPADTGGRVFVLGGESRGLSRQARKKCHRIVNIPLSNAVESLNVSITAALVVFRGRL